MNLLTKKQFKKSFPTNSVYGLKNRQLKLITSVHLTSSRILLVYKIIMSHKNNNNKNMVFPIMFQYCPVSLLRT